MGWRVKRNRPDVSVEAQFRRSPFGRMGGNGQQRLAEATLRAYCGQFQEALDMLGQLQQKRPRDPEIRQAIVNVKQLSGDFSPEQWHDVRLLGRARAERPRIPVWQGEPMPGDTLLLWHRGLGLGDVIQLARMVAPVKQHSQAAHVILHVPPALMPLMRSLDGPDTVVDTLPTEGYARHLPLMPPALMPLMRSLDGPDTVVDTLPTEGYARHLPLILTPAYVVLTPALFGAVPYLAATPDAIDRWRPTCEDRRLLHIGLHFRADAAHTSGRERSLPLKALAPLFDLPGTRWYSLQPGAAAEVATYPQLIDFGAIDREPFMETAGLLHHLDLLLACDSSLSHLAGALGTPPVWLLLDFFYDARWGQGQETTVWYPRHRLFQQDQPGDWPSVVKQVAEELTRAITDDTLRRR